ncbi:unnamed protein product [marine sediment metagenome]|uniref:DUF2283 domain-containing protein n=1 Tax=marine sediment metagenome TaxID=412755 RepID=X1M4K3_9ZZZZ
MKGKMNIYYDEEGDYLEIFIENKSPTYGEDIEEDITLFKTEETDEIVGIGILNFKKRTKSLKDIKLNLPFEVNFSTLKV